MNSSVSADALIPLAKAAAKEALRFRDTVASEEKFPVTDADRASNALLEKGLSRYGLPVVSEENDVVIPDAGDAWVIDPLDGSADFIAGDGDWCIMVGLVREGSPILGIVYALETDICWTAEKGKGAFLHHGTAVEKMTVSAISSPEEGTFLVSKAHPSDKANTVLAMLRAKSRAIGSIGIKFGTIAGGNAEMYATDAPLGEWDVCAPQLILEEAGGKVTDLSGNAIRYGAPARRLLNGCAASNRALHPALLHAMV
ncbi:MAG TPA: 3'(2'),5'-bisphosphate nucleotidase CysQ [Candidatus Paceibacterota bacterium]|nr:3'(2'),5'-bisphosphate nucleotidase CysQ [Candidatus Paceibacterota bacterium]